MISDETLPQGVEDVLSSSMSKSRGNVVDPDQYDPDHLRLYLMFMGPYTDGGDWSDQHIQGVARFCRRWQTWVGQASDEGVDLSEAISTLERGIDGHVQRWKFNRVVSDLMTFYNQHKGKTLMPDQVQRLIELTTIFAPGLFQAAPKLTPSV